MPLPQLPNLKVQLSVVDDPLGLDPSTYVGLLTFGGWNDITSDVREVTIQRGRSNDLEKVGTGTATITLSNEQRQYDPFSTSGPFYDPIADENWLYPRNQVRVFGVYPNDPTVDGLSYNMQNETVASLTSHGNFYVDGYSADTTVAGGVSVGLTSTLNRSSFSTISVEVYVKPAVGVLWSDPAVTYQLFELPTNGMYAYVNGGYIVVARNYSPSATILDAPLPVQIADTDKGMWLRITVGATASAGSIQWCPDQFQPPSTWTDITRVKNSSISMSGTNTTVQVLCASLFGDPTYWPVYARRIRVYGDSTMFLDWLPYTHISLFEGYLSGWPQDYDMTGKDATVTVNCFDNSGLLGNMKVPTDLLETVIPPLSPWGWWKLGDASDNCVDYSGNDHDLTYLPANTFQHATDVRVAPGLSGVASVFSPSTVVPYIQSGHVAPDLTSNMSVSLWILADGTAALDRPQLFGLSGAAYRLRIELDQGVLVSGAYRNKVRCVFAGVTLTSTNYVTDGLPHHIAVTYNSSTGALAMYVDGVVSKGTTGTGSIGATHGGKVTMGALDPTFVILNTGPYFGAMQDVVYWNDRQLTATQVNDIFNAGYGYLDELSGARLDRVLDYAGFPERLRNIDPATYGTCGAVEYTEDQALLELMQKVEDTEVGILFTNRSGQLTLRGRYYLSMSDTGINRQALFDDTGTNIGYQNLRFQYDAEQLVNDHIIVDDIGAEYQSDDPQSVTWYGRRSRSIDTLLNDTVAARNMAIGLTNIYAQPILKAEPFDLVPLGTQWLKVLPLDIGDRVNLKATPLGIPPQIDKDMALQSVSYSIRPKDWNVTVIGSPRPMISYFVLGDGTIQVIRQNLITNTKAALNTTGWSIAGTGTSLTRNTTVGRSGTTSFQATQPTPTGMTVSHSGLFTTTGGVNWRFAVYARTASSSDLCQVAIDWFDSGGAGLGTASSPLVSVSSGSWTPLSLGVAAAPFAARQFRPKILVINSTVTTVYLTDFILESTSFAGSPLPFFDGDSADNYSTYATLDYGWFGTANASSSFAEFGIASAQNLGSVLDGPDVLGF
jgi:hypothetical protein